MALVCDIESTPTPTPAPAEEPAAAPPPVDDDLEDGEIEDDGDDEVPMEPPKEPETAVAVPLPTLPKEKERGERGRHERERRRHDEKKKHMTEAEKSILHLRKRERMQREKWEKYRKEQQTVDAPVVDDFASNIEKAIASVLKKDSKHISDEEKDDEKKGRKRKNRDKDRQKGNKQRKVDSPKGEDVDENEFLNMRSGSPKSEDRRDRDNSHSPRSEDSYETEDSGEERREKKKEFKKGKNRNRDRNRRKSRDMRNEQQQMQLKDAQGVCVFFLQGKCQKNDCPYSHEAVPPMKLELCKFYLKDCCAKGEKCSYMHGEFPCKFYHTGLVCLQGENCKFAHGRPLDEHRRQILFKHIETAPREILGGFPRMSREEALNKINLAQQNLVVQYGPDTSNKNILAFLDANVPIPAELNSEGANKLKGDKPSRNRPSRWQDPDPLPTMKPFNYGQDQDMRINSNGDIDMRTLPPLTQIAPQNNTMSPEEPPESEMQNFTQDIDIRNPNMLQFDTKDIDIRHQILATKDVDIRQIPPIFTETKVDDDDEEESKLQIDTGEEPQEEVAVPPNLPKTQRELYMRIQSQQKTNLPEQGSFEVEENINWYSDDDDDDENRLTIKVDNEEEKKEESDNIMSPPQIKPLDVVEKLGDLSKIDISAEVTKLLTSMTQTANTTQKEAAKPVIRDPRQRPPQPEKLSIYEQGSISTETELRSPDEVVDSDFRSRPDVDLRNLSLPFKGMLNYTPAKEIDASVNSHPPMTWKVDIVDIPRPDYTGLKLNVQDAEKTGDPRLRKIFRLSTEEKDSPASPKASPKAGGVRIDPRLKKQEESKQQDSPGNMTYNQQLNILQSSAFFQSLTSNQKVLLNQELSSRNDQNGFSDPVLGSMLSSLNLVPNSNLSSPNMGAALSILANVNKLNPPMMGNPAPAPMVLRQNPNIMNQMAQSIVQPGLLGAAPGIPNLPSDFPMNFDPRNGGGMMNNAPPGPFGNFPPPNDNFGNFDEYYPPQDNFHPGGNNRDNRNFNRDRRRGRNNFNRNNGNRNFRNRNNRNRGHTPP